MSDPRTRIAALLLVAVTVLIGWWAWKQGAYFGTVFYPGAFIVFGLLAMVVAFAPFAARVTGPARVALLALVALAVWMLLSALWSPTPAAAIRYAEHIFLYAALFALGIWIANLLGARMLLALTPLAIAGTLVAVATVIVLATGADVTWLLHEDATLRFPIGYRNANAAFFMICLWSVLALAVETSWRWELRALALGAGTVLLELTFLAQSRGSVPGVVLALLVYLIFTPNRLRAAVMLALMALPALLAVPTLLDVYRHGSADAAVIPLLRSSAKAIAATGIASLLVAGLALGGIAPRLRLRERTVTSIARVVAVASLLVVLIGGSLFVSRHGGPIGFVDQRVKEFDRVGYPDLHGQGIRYGANIGSNRHDFWRVAIDEGTKHPLLGGGGGAFQVAYLQHRLSDEGPEDPHSMEALMFSELGFPGLALLLTFVAAAALAGWRSKRLGPLAAGLVAGCLAGATQWFVQGSFDWIWNYPGITAPAMFVLGVAAAPALLDPSSSRGGWWRGTAVAALVALALLTVPLFVADRYAQRAYDESSDDPHGAILDLERAARLDPLDAGPLLSRGSIELKLGETSAALGAFREAVDREPDSYSAQYYLASSLAGSDSAAARVVAARAHELNPFDTGIKALQRRLDEKPPGA
ncbi:MAG TPA: O-antigen ligase family protein [Solirubrobacterales bacterium]